MKTLLLGLSLAALAGCVHMQPVGPLAKSTGTPKGRPPAAPEEDGPTVSAPRPAPPAMFIVPAEVTAENPAAAVQKLQAEFDADLKATPPPPRTAEVSVIKGGRR